MKKVNIANLRLGCPLPPGEAPAGDLFVFDAENEG